MCPPLFSLLPLRPRPGVRTFAHTAARLLNPLRCDGQLNGVFHTPYVARMAQVNVMLGQIRSLVFMGAEGEPELYADRQKLLAEQSGSELVSPDFPAAHCDPYPRQPAASLEDLSDRFSALLSARPVEGGDARERAVMQRMHEAFVYASTGALPLGWAGEAASQESGTTGGVT